MLWKTCKQEAWRQQTEITLSSSSKPTQQKNVEISRTLRMQILIIARVPARVISKVKGHQYRRLAGGYDLEIGHF